MAILKGLDGNKKIKNTYQNIPDDIAAVNTQLEGHVAGTSDNHNSEDINFSSTRPTIPDDNVKDAIETVDERIDGIVNNPDPNKDLELVDFRTSSEYGAFATAKERGDNTDVKVKTLEDYKNDDPYYLDDYGIVGDGITDDTAGFNLIETSVFGQIVNLKGKTFVVTSIPEKNLYVNGSWVLSGYSSVASIGRLNNPKFSAGNGQIKRLKKALTNDLEQYVGIVFIGDSITWGLSLDENPSVDPRDGTLSDVRDIYNSPSFVNNFKRYIIENFGYGYTESLSNWPAAPSGESILTLTKNIVMAPHEGDFFNTFVEPVADPVIVTDSPSSISNIQINLNVNSGTSGYYSLKFPFTGKEFKLYYASVVSSMKYELFVDGVSQGVFDTEIGLDGNVAGFNNSRTHTFNYVYEKEIEIRTVLGAYVGKNTLKIDGIEIPKTIEISNQGIIGATTRSYLSNNLPGNVSGDGDAISDEDKYVFIQLGTNDRIIATGIGKGTNTFKENLQLLIDAIKTDRFLIMMAANPSTNENPASYSFTTQDVKNVISTISDNNLLDFIDNYSIFANYNHSVFLTDGLHPNKLGHFYISQNIIGALELI